MRTGQSAKAHMLIIGETVPLTRTFLNKHIKAFVFEKFLLTPEECGLESGFDELALMSLAKTMKLAPELAQALDTSRSCDGATSVMAKKVLLFMAIQKGLNIELPADESARIKTLQDLCDLVWDTLAASLAWESRLEGGEKY